MQTKSENSEVRWNGGRSNIKDRSDASNPSTLAIIPARGGSKGIPLKNIAPLGGKPLIAYTIFAARESRSVERVVVSTDDERIASVARELGAETPFLRPTELALDETPGIDPMVHAAEWLRDFQGYAADYVVLLQPTSPFRTAEDIDAAVRLAVDKKADAVVSVTPAATHPHWTKTLRPDGTLRDYLSNSAGADRRQELPPAFQLNGAIYLVRTEVLFTKRTFYTERTFGYVMPPERSLDIDTPWDLQIAGLVVQAGVNCGGEA